MKGEENGSCLKKKTKKNPKTSLAFFILKAPSEASEAMRVLSDGLF